MPIESSSDTSHDATDALASLRIDRSHGDHQSTRGWKRYLIAVLLLALLLAGWQLYLRQNEPGQRNSSAAWMPEAMQKRQEVRLVSITVQAGRSADAVVVANGYLESRRQARIGARAAGRIDVVNFEEGDRVERGYLLAELEHRDLDASLAAADASVKRAEAAIKEQEIAIQRALADKDRLDKLRSSRSVSPAEHDRIRFTYESAVARKESMEADLVLTAAQRSQAEQMRENMFIRAPFSGTVISKDAEVGESILPGGMGGGSGRGSVATIADLDHLEIECDVQEALISRVREKQEAEIQVEAVQDKKYRGRVRKVIPMGDRARATIKVQVEITDADELLFPEMAGTVYFLPQTDSTQTEQSDEPRKFCPTSAVEKDENGEAFVWIVDKEKRAQRIAVEVGDDRDGRTEILRGEIRATRVIANPLGLYENAPVRVIE